MGLCKREKDREIKSKERRLGSWDLLSDIYGREEQLLGFFHKGFVGYGF